MKVKWLADDREVITGDERQEVIVTRGDVVDLPLDVARSVIEQGLAEMANKPKRRGHASADTEE